MKYDTQIQIYGVLFIVQTEGEKLQKNPEPFALTVRGPGGSVMMWKGGFPGMV